MTLLLLLALATPSFAASVEIGGIHYTSHTMLAHLEDNMYQESATPSRLRCAALCRADPACAIWAFAFESKVCQLGGGHIFGGPDYGVTLSEAIPTFWTTPGDSG